MNKELTAAELEAIRLADKEAKAASGAKRKLSLIGWDVTKRFAGGRA